MGTYKTLLYRKQGRIARITLNRPRHRAVRGKTSP